MFISDRISIPQVPKKNEVLESEQAVLKFANEASTSFEAIIHAAGTSVSQSQCHQYLETLQCSIKEVKAIYPEEFEQTDLTTLIANIKTTRQELRTLSRTDSHEPVQTPDRKDASNIKGLSTTDRYGRNTVACLLAKEGMTVSFLFESLKTLLNEVCCYNPSLTLFQIIQEWFQVVSPKILVTKDMDIKSVIASLTAMSEDPNILEDPIACTVCDYLLSCMDYDGSLRFKRLQSDFNREKINSVDYYRRVGQLIYTLHRFSRPYTHIIEQFGLTKQKLRKVLPCPRLLHVMRLKIGGKSVSRALNQLSRALNFKTYTLHLKVIEGDKFEVSERLTQLSTETDLHGGQLIIFIYNQIKSRATKQEQVCLIANFMHLGCLQVASGNFYSAYCIMKGIAETQHDPSLQPSWEHYLTLKHSKDYRFLDNLFRASNNLKTYRSHIVTLESKGVLCVPIFSIFKSDFDKIQLVASHNRDGTIKKLKTILTEDEFGAIYQYVYLDFNNLDKEEKERAVRHSLDDVQMFLHALDQVEIGSSKRQDAKRIVLDYIKAKKNTEASIERFNRSILSLCFTIQTQFAHNPIPKSNICHDFLDLIAKEIPKE